MDKSALTIPKELQRKPGDKVAFAHPLGDCRKQRNRDTNWIIDTMKDSLTKGEFFGSIKLNFQASRLITINVDRSYTKPETEESHK